MRTKHTLVVFTLAAIVGLAAIVTSQISSDSYEQRVAANSSLLQNTGKQIFRYDTFGDEHFWGGKLRLHQAIAGSANGGVGSGVSPIQALQLGLKVDAAALPPSLVQQIKAGQVDLTSPATTLALLKIDSVVGVKGFFGADGRIRSIGITCALCHSNVDDSFMPGIGQRLDGWPNSDLDVGAIVASAPSVQPFAEMLQVSEETVRTVLRSWGPGRYDAQLNLDGKAFRPDGKTAATLIPPAFGLAGVNLHTWTGAWGSIPYWNAYVANLEMHGQGNFFDPRLDDAAQYPVAARTGQGHVENERDLITSKLPALHAYQLALPTPRAPQGAFDPAKYKAGRKLFEGKAECYECHTAPTYTESGWNLHTGAEIGIDEFQAERSPDKRYRTTPLRALWSEKVHKRGFFHDGRFATLMEVVDHYNNHFNLGLTNSEKLELIEFLKSL